MSKLIVAIDPGLTGAIVFLDSSNGKVAGIFDMPISAATYGKGNTVNAHLLTDIFVKFKVEDIETVYIEQVSAMPGQGVSSMFKFGVSFGVLQGVASAFGLKIEFVTPQKWKKFCGLIGKEKDAARTFAINKFPNSSKYLERKKDCGRADALLIGLYSLSHR